MRDWATSEPGGVSDETLQWLDSDQGYCGIYSVVTSILGFNDVERDSSVIKLAVLLAEIQNKFDQGRYLSGGEGLEQALELVESRSVAWSQVLERLNSRFTAEGD